MKSSYNPVLNRPVIPVLCLLVVFVISWYGLDGKVMGVVHLAMSHSLYRGWQYRSHDY